MSSSSSSPANPDHAAQEALRLIGPAPANWVPAHAGIDHNVVIVGGGQTGSAFAFALQRAGIGGVSVIDAAADASQAGVWLTRARMHKLRTLKNLVGPEGPVSALGFQAWYEARHGQEAYAAGDLVDAGRRRRRSRHARRRKRLIDCGGRHYESARDHDRLGPRDGQADLQRNRLARPSHGRLLRRAQGARPRSHGAQ